MKIILKKIKFKFKIIRYQAQEINKLKKYISNLHFKLKYTQEALAREKIEAENSMIALQKVLYKYYNSFFTFH